MFTIRAMICEWLTALALKIAPDGYTPAMIDACVAAFKREGVFKGATFSANKQTG